MTITVELNQPGYIRAIVTQNREGTKIEWAHHSAWRFMPTQFIEDRGYCLHPIDLAINKTLALAGRDETRDFLDVIYAHRTLLALPGLVWAACGKDPGFSPGSLMELLQRKGRYRPEDFARLKLNIEINVQELKQEWLEALELTRTKIERLPTADVGYLYYDTLHDRFVVPGRDSQEKLVPHYAKPGGVLPQFGAE